MATSVDSNISECSICFESFRISMKFLPCGHTFCLRCIERCIADNRETFSCPLCQEKITIPEGGAKEFPTNYIAPSTTQPRCPNHNHREVDYYCNKCKVGLCSKCVFEQHKDHEALDIESDETRNKAIERLQHSQNFIENKIKNLQKSRSALLESFEQLKSLCEDSCAKVTEKTEKIVSDLRTSCKEIKNNIRKNLKENRSKVEDREKKITGDINLLKSKMESNISPSTKTTILNVFKTLPGLNNIEELCESQKDDNMCVQYLQWVGRDFNLDKVQLGSVISKPFYIPGSYRFVFDISSMKRDEFKYFSRAKYTSGDNNLPFSCLVEREGDYISIWIEHYSDSNRRKICILDGQISLLNIDDDCKTLTTKYSDWILEEDGNCHRWGWYRPITWSNLSDKKNGFLNSNNQFVIQCDITLRRDRQSNCILQ